MSRPRDHARALAAFEADLRARGRTPRTVVVLLSTARRFLAATPKPLGRVDADDVRRYLAARRDAGLAPSTQAGERARLRTFFRALREAGLVAADPTAGVGGGPVRHRAPVLLSVDAVGRLLRAAAAVPEDADARNRALALRDRALLEVLYATGCRASEARAARVEDLDLARRTMWVRRVKHGRPIRLPLPGPAVDALVDYLREGRPRLGRPDERAAGRLLVTARGGPLKRASLWAIVRRVSERAGVRAHPHAFRRALASHLVQAGLSVAAVQRLLGHANVSTTAVYLGVDERDLRAAVAALDLGA